MLQRLKDGAHAPCVALPRQALTRFCPCFCSAAEADNDAKQRLTKESAEREKLEAEERQLQEEEERRLDGELNAKAKAEARERMDKEAELRKKRISEREAAGARTSATAAPAPVVLKKSPGPSPGASPAASNGPTSPGAFSTGEYDDDDEDEPLPGDRVRSQIPREDVLEQLHAQAKQNAKGKADAWRGEREAARVAAEAKAAAKASEELRLAKAASEHKKTQEEEKKTKAAAEAKTKADAIAAMMSKLNEPELNVPEAAEGAFTYAKLKELSTKDAMRDAGILCVPPCRCVACPRAELTRLPRA
jgi:hypothetical protein